MPARGEAGAKGLAGDACPSLPVEPETAPQVRFADQFGEARLDEQE